MRDLFIVVVIVLIAGIIAFFIFGSEKIEKSIDSGLDNPFSESNDKETSNTADNEIQSQENSEENSEQGSGAGGGGGSGAGGGGSGQTTSSPSFCSQNQISYALRNFVKKNECLSYSGQDCTNKIVTCSVEVQNLDDSISGNFETKISLALKDTGAIVQEFILSEAIEYQNFEKFEKILQFQGEEALKDYECLFVLTSIP